MIAAVLVDRAAICCLLCFYALRCRSVVFLCSGYGFKYLLQRTFPCSQSLFHCNFYIPIGKHCIVFYFTNHNACDRKLCHFICRYFCYDASEICCKEVFFCYLCINLDTTRLTRQIEYLQSFLPAPDDAAPDEQPPREPENVAVMIENLMDKILAGADAHAMTREDRLEKIRFMDAKGIFLMKGSVDRAAEKLGVNRVTIYSYLDEVRGKRG